MDFEEFKKGFKTLPLGLMRVKIDEGGITYDSQSLQDHHWNIYAYTHLKYKSFVDLIREEGGYVLVTIDTNGNPISFEVKDVSKELFDKIK